MPKHTNIGECPSCAEKLLRAHPMLRTWFLKRKTQIEQLHVSWSYRDAASQEQAFQEGKSKLHFPNSAHNKQPALALDCFMLDLDGVAQWPPTMFAKINAMNEADADPIIWGGNFKSIGDSDHMQLDISKLPPPLT